MAGIFSAQARPFRHQAALSATAKDARPMNDLTFDHSQHRTTVTAAPAAAPVPADGHNSGATKALLAILLYVLLWGLAVAIWGLPALFLPAVAKTGIMFVVLVMITRG
ncbi:MULTISPECIES: hypothetical protein [unclassified Phaeobacter]|uniref:hypothetical protein n=1 Tax=unclassified Phaeobacter TaxID=2621772 RepID=UPI003A8579BB